MSGGGATAVWGCRAPFTAGQWQELEQQAMIYKYLVAGMPVPPDLVLPISRSFDAVGVSATGFFHHPAVGYYSYYGKKLDPEPGRCRRTDGKKWRCSKEAHSDSKYCERHMHRGRNRSRKHVESLSTSQSFPTATSHVSTGCSTKVGNSHCSGNGSFQNAPLYLVDNLKGSSFGRDVTKVQTEPASYGIDNKELRYSRGLSSDSDEHTFTPESSGGIVNLGIGSNAASRTGQPVLSQLSSSPSFKQNSGSPQQHCFFGNNMGSRKEEQHPEHVFFSEWPMTKESWSNLGEDGSDRTVDLDS